MVSMRVLVVEDEESYRQALASGLGREGGRWGMEEFLDIKHMSMVLPA